MVVKISPIAPSEPTRECNSKTRTISTSPDSPLTKSWPTLTIRITNLKVKINLKTQEPRDKVNTLNNLEILKDSNLHKYKGNYLESILRTTFKVMMNP